MAARTSRSQSPLGAPLAVLLIATVVRAVWALNLPIIPTSDGTVYDLLARRLAAHQGYTWESGVPTAHWPVGTSLIYSRVFRATASPYQLIPILHIAFALVCIVVAMALAERWFGRAVGIVTGLLLALWPGQIQFTTVLASENFFLAFLLLALWSWTNRNWSLAVRAFASGIVLGLASYVRVEALLLPLVWGLPLLLEQQRFGRTAATVAGTLVVMAVLIAPWAMRNARVFGHGALISTNAGANLWIGNNPGGDGTYVAPPAALAGENEAQWDARLRTTALRYITENPGAFAWRTVRKAIRLHDRETIGVAWNRQGLEERFGARVIPPLKLVSSAYWWALLAAAAVAVVRLVRRRGWWRTFTHPAIITWLYFTVVHSVMETQDRYHYPIVPLVAALAALTLTPSLQRWTGFPPTR